VVMVGADDSAQSSHLSGYSAETRNSRLASNCVVVDAVRIEPVSVAKFPSTREKNREFRKFEG
jgi:hypothetical protein